MARRSARGSGASSWGYFSLCGCGAPFASLRDFSFTIVPRTMAETEMVGDDGLEPPTFSV